MAYSVLGLPYNTYNEDAVRSRARVRVKVKSRHGCMLRQRSVTKD